jgi:hypothetical protein
MAESLQKLRELCVQQDALLVTVETELRSIKTELLTHNTK